MSLWRTIVETVAHCGTSVMGCFTRTSDTRIKLLATVPAYAPVPLPVRAPSPASPPLKPAAHDPVRRASGAKFSLVAPPICVPPPATPAAPAVDPVAEADAQRVSDLLKDKCYGTAVEELEAQLRRRPDDFDLLFKLARVHADHCGTLKPAERIVKRIEAGPSFTPEQKQQAAKQLRAWQSKQAETAFFRT